MFPFFHPIGFPAWMGVAAIAIILFCVLLTVRGAYVLAATKSFRFLLYSFGVFSIIWATFLLTGSETVEMICVLFTLPFGIFAGIPLLFFGEPPASMMYFGAAFLNRRRG